MSEKPPAVPIRRRQRDLTRRVILNAALEAFSELGFFYVSIDEIVQRAGVSRATFYVHFTDKSTLLRELRDEKQQILSGHAGHGWATNDQESLEAFFEGLVDLYSETPKLFQALHEAEAAEPEFAENQQQSMEQLLKRMLESGPMKGESEEHVRLALAMLYSLVDNFLHTWIVGGWPLDRPAAIKAMANAMMGVLR